MNKHEKSHYRHPSTAIVLKAVPMLQWRKCWECGHIGLYRSNMLPACQCEECGKQTRAMPEANALLHRTDEPEEE